MREKSPGCAAILATCRRLPASGLQILQLGFIGGFVVVLVRLAPLQYVADVVCHVVYHMVVGDDGWVLLSSRVSSN